MMKITNDIWKHNDYPNLVALFESAEKKYANNPFFGTKNTEGTYEWETYQEIGQRIQHLRSALADLGLQKDDRVGIISKNRSEWFIAEMATLSLGGWFIPMYEKELFSVWEYIISNASCKILFVSTEEIYEKIKDLTKTIPTLEHIILIQGTRENSMQTLEQKGKTTPVPAVYPEPKDVALIIYTSGTTGKPKGVMLSHGNLCFAAQAGYHLYKEELNEHTVSFSHLPWAHSYAISAELHNSLQFGGSIAFLDTIKKMSADIKTVKPTVLMSVPRVFNQIYKRIHRKIKQESKIKQILFHQAIKVAKKRFITGKTSLRYRMLNKLVLEKIRDQFGGRLLLSLTASAHMNAHIALFFYSIGIPTYDAYGLTESSPVITMNAPKAYRFGSVGKPVEHTNVVIDKNINDNKRDDGEIIVYGPQIMLGYYNLPEETKKVLQDDGGLRTGDRGKFDNDGYLFITGRIKEQYKLQNGKYIFPASLEEDINALPYVAQSMVYGDGKEYNICIVVLDTENIHSWAEEMQLDIPADELEKTLSNPASEIHQFLTKSIKATLKKRYHHYEIPRKYLFITEPFTHENDMLTQTMKIKRRTIKKRYQTEIRALYQS